MNPVSDKYRLRLTNLLKELFQLDQPELDFGLYKIMHLKSEQITRFLENDLLKEIEQAFGEKETVDAAALKESAIGKLTEALGEDALDVHGKLQEAFAKLPAGKKYLEEIAAAETAKDALNAESEIYDHLYRFFERYYDNGDFMSRRYYARESDARAAPYSIPYDGREVYLHWANKDQYYIKSSEYLSNYTFELNEAIRQEVDRQKTLKGKGQSFDFGDLNSELPLKVHFRLIDASEGEHGNIKTATDQKRFFILHAATPIKVEQGELVIQFEYRSDKEKNGQDNKWQETRLQQAEVTVLDLLKNVPDAQEFLKGLALPAPTDSKDKRTLLGKHMQKYASKNSMDYFIHKDLGGFLRRELDFYIKNEIMHLDDLENADVPKVEQYLSKVKVLRRIASQLIVFLAQLEEFQKKLWLKKKFVVETNYCITLDRIPEKFYAEIASNGRQHDEWVKLFAIDEIQSDLHFTKYSSPLSVDFLKSNPFLLVDTSLFDENFKQKLLSEIIDLDKQCDGVLIHSENFNGLGLVQKKILADMVYTDPPYNKRKDNDFAYKDAYQRSSWASMIYDRFLKIKKILKENGSIFTSIDDNEFINLTLIGSSSLGLQVKVLPAITNLKGNQDSEGFSSCHEYIVSMTKSNFSAIGRLAVDEESLLDDWLTDSYGLYKKADGLRATGANAPREKRPNLWYPIFFRPDGSTFYTTTNDKPLNENDIPIYPINDEGIELSWYWKKSKVNDESYNLIITKSRSGEFSLYKKQRAGLGDIPSKKPKSFFYAPEYSSTHGGNLAQDIFGQRMTSFTPKSVKLIEDIVDLGLNANSGTVVDVFAGSGTTGHAVINLNNRGGDRRYVLIEQGDQFDCAMIIRLKKVIYSRSWSDGKPVSREGTSHCFKYLRLESYEDSLNNLSLTQNKSANKIFDANFLMQRDYLLNYFLNVETQNSQSLLNIDDFRDPNGYKMWIKKVGSEERTLQPIDLIETFNWLIGLWVEHLATPVSFNADFVREKDDDLPEDQNTRLVCTVLKQDRAGAYWFRLVEGYTLKIPGDKSSKIKTLVVWRKQTEDAEKDNAVLQKYLMEKLQISPRDKTYDVIYVSGSHTLPNPVVEGEQTKVRLIEEAFHTAMWSEEAA